MELTQEKIIFEQIKQHPEVFGQIFEEYYPKILAYTLRRVGHVQVAEDITSETFFKSFKSIPRFKWKVSFSAWIYKIATNEINLYYRSGKYQHISLDVLTQNGFDFPSLTNVEQEVIEAETRLQRHQEFLSVQQELKKLPLKYQEVVALRYFENMKLSEISEILGKKEGTIKSLLSRGLALLREHLSVTNQCNK